MQAPGTPDEDSSNGFHQGGWQFPYVDEEAGRLVANWMGAADAFLLGRKTYETFAAHWPRVTAEHDLGGIAALLNNLPKYVRSTTLDKLDWVLDLAAEVGALLIVSDDTDLTSLSPWRGTPILRPREFVAKVDAMRRHRRR